MLLYCIQLGLAAKVMLCLSVNRRSAQLRIKVGETDTPIFALHVRTYMHVRASMYVCGRVASYVTFVRTSESKKVVWKESFKVARSMRATTGFWKKMSFPEVLTVGKIEEENGKQMFAMEMLKNEPIMRSNSSNWSLFPTNPK